MAPKDCASKDRRSNLRLISFALTLAKRKKSHTYCVFQDYYFYFLMAGKECFARPLETTGVFMTRQTSVNGGTKEGTNLAVLDARLRTETEAPKKKYWPKKQIGVLIAISGVRETRFAAVRRDTALQHLGQLSRRGFASVDSTV